MINEIKGDLFSSKDDFLFHSVNCKKRMGSGVALAIRNKFPRVYEEYLKEPPRLGKCLVVKENGIYIANLYGQDGYGYDGRLYTNYDALREAFGHMFNMMKTIRKTSCSGPRVGAGLGGGDFNIIKQIIQDVMPEEFTVNIYYL